MSKITPDIAEGVIGPQMMQDFRSQAARFGGEFITDNVTRVDFSSRPFRVWVGEREYRADAVIVSTGAVARTLGLESEKRMQGFGVTYCATCDGAFYRDKEVAVVGGGDSAMEEAIFLTQLRVEGHGHPPARHVPRLADHGRPRPRQREDRVRARLGRRGGRSATRTSRRSRSAISRRARARRFRVEGLFVAIGHDPASALFQGQLDMDDEGYILTEGKSTVTNIEGVFAAGDVVDHVYRQAMTAAGMGCMAALDAERYMSELDAAPRPVEDSALATP